MIRINNKDYSLVLFDTNALSSFLQNPMEWIRYYADEFSLSSSIISYSVFTLSELYYRQELFSKYIEIFSEFPSVILDGHESIFLKEIDNYAIGADISPIIVAPFAINEPSMTRKEILLKVIENSGFVSKTEYWKSGQEEVLSGIINLKNNYPPKKDKYTIKEVEHFNFIVSTSQIGIRNHAFAKNIISTGEAINLERFLSLKCTSYFVFYKFYPDNRKPINSDVFDIMITALLPYVDSFITEGNMFEIIKRIQRNHNFLDELVPYKLKDINKLISDIKGTTIS